LRATKHTDFNGYANFNFKLVSGVDGSIAILCQSGKEIKSKPSSKIFVRNTIGNVKITNDIEQNILVITFLIIS
jgi:hypothetical protein